MRSEQQTRCGNERGIIPALNKTSPGEMGAKEQEVKKMWLVVLAIVLTIGATLGATFGIYSCVKNKKDTAKNGIKYEIQYLQSEYRTGEDLVIKIKAYCDKELTAIKYSIDNGNETDFTVVKYKTPESEKKNGENCIDTGAEVLSLSSLTGDTHLITFYVYEGENRTSLGTYTFHIVS